MKGEASIKRRSKRSMKHNNSGKEIDGGIEDQFNKDFIELFGDIFEEEAVRAQEAIEFEDIISLEKTYEKMLKETSNEDFIPDAEKYKQYLKVCAFFDKLAKKYDGKIIEINLTPKELHGGLIFNCDYISIDFEILDEFKEILNYVSGIDIQPKLDGTCDISVTVPNVFKMKES